MQKKLGILMIIISVSYVFYSCLDYSLPEQVELEVEGSINLPVKTATSSWGKILAEYLEKAFSENIEEEEEVKDRVKRIEVYNVNYGQAAQAFCVYIPIDISDSLNPDDHLPDIDALTKQGTENPLKIEETVEMSSFDDFTFSCTVKKSLSDYLHNPPGMGTAIIPGNIEIEIPVSVAFLPPSINSTDFLHAKIQEGYFTMDLDLSEGNVILTKDQFDFSYDINITQKQPPYTDYPGFTYKSKLSGEPSDLETRSLEGQEINTEEIEIKGTVTLSPKAGGGNVTIQDPEGSNELEGQLKITMNFTRFSEVDWYFGNIAKEMKADSYSLAPAAKYLNWIEFDQCGVDDITGEAISGIGININFTEIIDGLKLSVGSNDDMKFADIEHKPIHTGNNIFGNSVALKDGLRLDLTKYKNDNKKLEFEITLLPSDPNNPDVLHLTDLEVGKPLTLKGEAHFFQHWIKAEVNMTEALRAEGIDGDAYIGTYPDKSKNEPPIDYLGKAKEYIKGFKFIPGVLQTSVYLSGPDETIRSIEAFHPRLSLMAQYTDGDTFEEKVFIDRQDEGLTLAKDNIVIKDNPDYLDNKIYKRSYLPPGGNPVEELVTVINAMPGDLRFQYNVTLPATIIVEPYMFIKDDETVPHEISATIIMLIHMELTAGDEEVLTDGSKGSKIIYPDMFSKDQIDILGRNPDKNDPSKPEQDSMFTSLDVGFIRFAVDFAGTFFTGANLFIEKYEKDEEGNVKYKPILFPHGIPVNGSKIGVNITNNNFNIFKNNFINPDFRLEFGSGSKITIPRKMGLTTLTIEAKGKTSVTLDF